LYPPIRGTGSPNTDLPQSRCADALISILRALLWYNQPVVHPSFPSPSTATENHPVARTRPHGMRLRRSRICCVVLHPRDAHVGIRITSHASRVRDTDNPSSYQVAVLDSMTEVFGRFCTSKPRPHGRNGSFQNPPEYNPEVESIVTATLTVHWHP